VSAPGKSYGWPCYEGGQRTPGYDSEARCSSIYAQEGTAAAQVTPDHEWRHGEWQFPPDWTGPKEIGRTALGGPTYTGSSYPSEYRGTAFYGDFEARTIRRLIFDAGGKVARTEPFATGSEWMVDLEAGPTGNLVTVDIAYGVIREIVYSPNREPKAVATATPRSGTAPLNVSFDATGSTDPDNDTLSYDWDFGDGTAHSSASKPSHSYSRAGGFTATLTVTDGKGGRDSTTMQITPGESRPTATISAPLDESTYRDGAAIDLAGSATDAQDGGLDGSQLEWKIVLHHDTHIHPGATKTGTSASFTASTDHDADSYYEVILTATDSAGLKSDPKTIQLRPETTSVELKSDPAGASMTYAGRNVAAPFGAPTAVGFKTELSAAPSFVKDGRTYVFQRWSDGGPRARPSLLVPPGGIDLTASYSDATPAGGAGTPTTPPAPGAAPPATPGERGKKDPRAYWNAIRATKGLRASYGLGDRGATARPARGSARGRYRGRPQRTRPLVKGSLDGAARRFGSRRDSLSLPTTALSGRPRLSAELWLKFGRPAARTILASPRTLSDELTLSMTAGGRAVAELDRFMGKTRVFGPKMKANAAHHLVVTSDGRRLGLYIDGVLARAQSGTARAGRLRRGLTLARGPGAGDHLQATLDELALYDRPLSPAIIGRHYDAGR
ncbi:MAG: PKD domain-containing protein, partial [Thermoleophilaceae bacterium]